MGTLLVSLLPAIVALGPQSPVVYQEGFESGEPSWAIWAKSVADPCEVNFLGPTDEKAFAGKRSLKLDLTFHDGSYCYFGTPVKLPAAGDLKLRGYLCVEQIPDKVRVGLGWNVNLPPSGHSGCSAIETLSKPTDGWQPFEVDLAAIGDRTAEGVLGTPDVLRYLDRIAVMFTGRFPPGGRAVVYLDELTITGHVPADYEGSMRARVEKAVAEQRDRIAGWATRAREAQAALEKLRSDADGLPEPIRRHATQVAAGAKTAIDSVLAESEQRLARARWLRPAEQREWTGHVAAVRSAVETLRGLSEYARTHDAPYVIYTRPAIDDQPLLPDVVPVPAQVGDTISLWATPGEYEPATFAIFACRDLDDVRLAATDLEGDAGKIPGAAVDLHVVKVWYQAGMGSIGAGAHKPQLVPELLVKDDALIRVDTEAKRNLMRHTGDDGRETYVCISDLDPEKMPNVAPRDAETLQPFDVPADSLKQIWVTVQVPDSAPPGPYRGAIRIQPRGEPEARVSVRLRVLPFRLRPTMLVQSIYYRGRLAPNRHAHAVNSEYRTPAQLEAEMRDMAAHGLNSPTTYQPFDAELPTVLAIRNRAGFRSGPLFTLGQSTGSSSDPGRLASLQAAVRKWLELAGRHGHSSVYFYGEDEARGERLAAQRPAWQAVREAGGKTFVAGYHGSFESVGDLQDVLVFAGPPDAEEAAKYHGLGHQVFSYANPQCGCEQPERYRRNFGLLLWKNDFDGAMDYAYQHSFGHIWNDFDHRTYRDHVMAYPTVDGVVDTLQWEGYREGVDDTRYLATLLDQLRTAPPERASVANAARKWLDELDVDGDLDAIRRRMIDWILELQTGN